MAEQQLAGYHVTIEAVETTTTPVCVSCFEQNGWQIWGHTPITYQDAEQDCIKCDWCHQLLIADCLQRQIDAQGKLLRDWYGITEYGTVGTGDFSSSEESTRLEKLKKQTEPYYYQYAEHKIW